MRLTDRRFATLLLVPTGLYLLLFVGWPLGKLVVDSLFDIRPLHPEPQTFVGLTNYMRLLESPEFAGAAGRTLVYTALAISFEFTLGLAMALLFTFLGQRSAWLRTVFLYPLMIAPVVAGLLWRFLLIDNFGIVSRLLFEMGIIPSPGSIGWLSDPDVALFSVALPDIWLTTSFVTLVLYAGLQTVPPELVEAGRLDGAGQWALLRRIVIPHLRPVIGVALLIRGIDAAKAFDTIVIQTGGGPQNSTETLSLLVFRTMVSYGQPGLASAMSVVFLVVMLLVAFVAIKTVWAPGDTR